MEIESKAPRRRKKFMSKLTASFLFIIGITLLVCSCETLNSKKNKKPEKKAEKFLKRVEAPKLNKPSSISSDIVNSYEFRNEKSDSDTLGKLEQSGRKTTNKRSKPFYEKYLKDEKEEVSDDKGMDVTLAFDAAEVADVIPAFSQLLNFNYLLDPQVKGAVTMNVNSKMTKRELWEVFEQILWLSGAYCSPDGDLLHILPFKDMPQERRLLVDHEPRANVEVAFLAIKNASSKDMLEKLKPFLTEGATAIDISHQNSILLVEAPSNIPKLRRLASLLDRKNKADWPQVVIRCVNVSASRIKDELAEILPVLGFPATVDNPDADPGAIHLVSIERMQVLIASAANDEALDELRTWVRVLDRSDVGEQERVFIYNIENGKADELTQALSVIFATSSSTLSVSSSGSSKSSSSSGASASSSKKSTTKATTGKSNNQSGKTTGHASVFEVPVTIFADAVQNRLVIRTTPRTYAMVKALLNRLDTAPSQVLLQLMVAEITLTDDTQFGLEFSGRARVDGFDTLYGTNYQTLSPGNDYGASYWMKSVTDPSEKFAYVRALAGRGKVEVVSSPQLLVVSHTEAKISVGDKVPIITQEIGDTQSTTTSDTSLLRSVQYEDTGIILIITPHVTKGGLITLDLEQTVSDAVENTTSGIDSPVIQERIIKTSMAIRDGSTLIVGGIIREKLEETINSLPFFIDIPILGNLLGDNDIKKKRTELLVMVTGKIVTETTKLEDLTARYRQAVKAVKAMNKLNRWEGFEKKLNRSNGLKKVNELTN